MTAQQLTQPHSADRIEHSHHVESSEGHQVPGPPHSHGHDHHHPPDTGPVVAVITIVVLLIGAAWIGLRAPDLAPEDHAAPSPAAAGQPGVVVLDDGRVFSGEVTYQPKTITIRSEEHGQVVVPREKVRWDHTGGTTLTEDYWRRFGHLPVEATRATQGGGIVVIDTGEVFTGRLIRDERGVTVRWPGGGEVTVPHERVRWWSADGETLTEDYWQKFGDLPLDPRWQRGDGQRSKPEKKAEPDRRGAARPAGGRDKRAAANLARMGERWGEAMTLYAELYREKKLPADLDSALHCARNHLQWGFSLRPPAPTTAELREVLEPLSEVPAVRELLLGAYQETALFYVVHHVPEEARRWATAFQAAGGDPEQASYLLRAAAEVERHMESEAQEHADDDGHGH